MDYLRPRDPVCVRDPEELGGQTKSVVDSTSRRPRIHRCRSRKCAPLEGQAPGPRREYIPRLTLPTNRDPEIRLSYHLRVGRNDPVTGGRHG